MFSKEDEAIIREAVGAHTARIDTFLNGIADYPSDRLEGIFLYDTIGYVTSFEPGARSKIGHDINHFSSYERNCYPEIPARSDLEVCARGRKRIMRSVLAEFGVVREQIDLYGVVQDNVHFLSMWNKWEHLVTAVSCVEPGKWLVSSQEDVLFRILLNVTRNGQQAIRYRFGGTNTEGKMRFECRETRGQTILDISDNGQGFNVLFEHINYRPTEEDILLADIIDKSRGVSGFNKVGLGGSGHGLGIMKHLGDIIGVTITVKNPRLIDGACVSLGFPG